MADQQLGSLVTRGIYQIHSRNLDIAVYDGREGFIGIREKFGSTYLFTEYAWEQGPPFGTVRVEGRVHVGDLLPHVPLTEYLGLICITCRHRMADNWRSTVRDHDCGCVCEQTSTVIEQNKQLYDALIQFEPETTKAAWERSRDYFSDKRAPRISRRGI
jgi:hypothetical protein